MFKKNLANLPFFVMIDLCYFAIAIDLIKVFMNAALDDDHVALSINLAKSKTYQNCPFI